MIFTALVHKILDQPTCEALIQTERRQELIDIRQMTRKEETSCAQFDCISLEETEQGHRLEGGFFLEDFKITERLGEGGFDHVVLAKKKSTGGHSSSEEVFVLKLVPTKHMSVVEKEVLIRAVGHPFLVQLLAHIQTKELFCYVMEDCEGGTPHSLISRHN
jgi:serine/threonine protein kinase